MLNHFNAVTRFPRRALAPRIASLGALAAVLSLTGCVVNNGPARGTVIVLWDTQIGYGCASLGIDSINVVVDRDSSPYGTFTNGICASGQKSIDVAEGTYTMHVEGISASGALVAVSPAETIPVTAFNTVYSDTLVLAPVIAPAGGSSIQVAWTVAGQAPATACGANNLKAVVLSVLDSSQTKVLGTAQAPCATGVARVSNLAAGNYYIQIDGYTPSDLAGHPSWGTSSAQGPFALADNTDLTFNTPTDINNLSASSTPGGLSLGWTTFATPAATGCGKYVIDKLNVTVLAADKTQELQTLQVACSAGQISFSNLPVGDVYVRIDEANPPDTSAYGNINLAGPFTIVSGQTASVSAPIDIGQRTIVAVPVGFGDGGTCSGHGVSSVQYQISGDGKLIVPFSDADATKPCELSTAGYQNHVIDLAASPPACAVPGNVSGLVVCNATGITALTIQAHGLVGSSVGYGAKMDVTGLSDGKLTKVQTPIALQTCGAGDPLCQ